MNCIQIKSHDTEGVVSIELYDTDTDGVSGFALETSNLWHWLSQCRPCQVRVRGREYLLQRPTGAAGWSVPDVYVGMEN
jgi:hypothetical protein